MKGNVVALLQFLLFTVVVGLLRLTNAFVTQQTSSSISIGRWSRCVDGCNDDDSGTSRAAGASFGRRGRRQNEQQQPPTLFYPQQGSSSDTGRSKALSRKEQKQQLQDEEAEDGDNRSADDVLDDILQNLLQSDDNDDDTINNNSATAFSSSKTKTMNQYRPPELSPYYKRDQDDFYHKPIAQPEALARLLEERHDARQQKNYALVKDVDSVLQRDHGVYVYTSNSNSNSVWTRRRRPPVHYQQQKKQMEEERRRRRQKTMTTQYKQQQEQIYTTATASSPLSTTTTKYSIDSIICQLSQRDIDQMIQDYDQYLQTGQYEDATLLRYQAKLQGLFLQED